MHFRPVPIMRQNAGITIIRTGVIAAIAVVIIGIAVIVSTQPKGGTTEPDSPVADESISVVGDTESPARTPSPALQAGEESGDFIVGVLYWSMNIPGQVVMREGLEAQARRFNATALESGLPGIELIPNVAGDGVAGMEHQIQQMNDLIERRVDLIIVQPTDIAALSEPLHQANQAGIPVVSYDQHILGGTLASYVTSDNFQAGYVGGEYVAAHFPHDRTLRVILIEYPHVSATVTRVNGFIDALEDYGQAYEIVRTYVAVEPVGGKEAGEAILRDFPESGSVDVIFANNDGGGLAIVEVLEAAGRDEVFFATVDGDQASVENIRREGIIRIDAAQFCGEVGAEAMRIAYRLLRGERVEEEILIPVFPITRETVDMYGGWTAPVPQPFEKPWHSNSPRWRGDIIFVDASEGNGP